MDLDNSNFYQRTFHAFTVFQRCLGFLISDHTESSEHMTQEFFTASRTLTYKQLCVLLGLWEDNGSENEAALQTL